MRIDGDDGYRLMLKQRYQHLEGTVETKDRQSGVLEPKMNGAEIRFALMQGASRGQFSGRVDGNRMEGTASFDDGRVVRWSASKDSSGPFSSSAAPAGRCPARPGGTRPDRRPCPVQRHSMRRK